MKPLPPQGPARSSHRESEDELRQQALALSSEGRFEEAEALYQQLRDQLGDSAELLNNHAIVCGALGQLDRKLELLEQAVACDPQFRPARFNLAATHIARKDGTRALADYQALQAEDPSSAEAQRGIGRAHSLLKDHDAALIAFERACALAPMEAQQWLDLGRTQWACNQTTAAEASLRQAAQLDPGNSRVALALAVVLHQQGRVEDAIAAMRSALAARPDQYDLLIELGSYLQESGRVEESLDVLFYAISLEPSRSQAIARTALSLLKLQDIKQAMELLTLAESMDPLDPQTLNLLGICLADSGLPSQALRLYQKGLELTPDNTDLLNNMLSSQLKLGQLEEAIATGLKALALQPGAPIAISQLMFAYAAQADRCSDAILSLGAQYCQQLRAPRPVVAPESLLRPPFSATTPRQLRIGVLTAEIGNPVVASFLNAFLQHYDRSAFHVELISTARLIEATAAEAALRVDAVNSLDGIAEPPPQEFLRERRYDIIVETCGFSRASGIGLLVQRCAPIQCHYIGYHASTGIDSIDYFIGDAETAGPDLQPQFVETLWRLPRPWLAASPTPPPPPATSLAETSTPILGSFNQLAKIREQTLAYWSAALLAVPGAILVIKDHHCRDDRSCERILESLGQAGVGRDRIRFLGSSATYTDHLAMYNQIDVALDATPWSSASTGFDALKMGVPLVAIRGQCMAARMSTSLVKAVGHPEWIAASPAQFARITADLCAALTALRSGKAALQHQVLASPLFDSQDLATYLGQAFQAMAAAKLG